MSLLPFILERGKIICNVSMYKITKGYYQNMRDIIKKPTTVRNKSKLRKLVLESKVHCKFTKYIAMKFCMKKWIFLKGCLYH